MSILDEARKAISMISAGRATLKSLKHQVADGKHAIDATTQDELNALLEKEEGETKAVIADLKSAIADYRAGG